MTRRANRLTVEFIDDSQRFLNECRDRFQEAAPKELVDVRERKFEDVLSSVRQLDGIRREVRKAKSEKFDPKKSPYSDVDIVLIDYDLLELEDATALTGEDIAYLLRCFTTCGLIIVLNPPDLGTNFFDLRLRRSMDSWADLVLGSDQLNNSWLWSDEPKGFAPWFWPNLATAVRRRQKQIEKLKGALDKPVVEVLGFPEEARIALDHDMAEAVFSRRQMHDKKAAELRTIRGFLNEPGIGVHRRDVASLEKRDELLIPIGAARIAQWLQNVVVPTQSVIIDAPHLTSRLPGLLSGNIAKQATWNLTTRRHELDPRSVGLGPVSKYRFVEDFWISAPAWYWPQIIADKHYFDWAQTKAPPEFVFCEDTSTFVKRTDAKQFMADVPGQAALRYVQIPLGQDGPSYRPSVRLSM